MRALWWHRGGDLTLWRIFQEGVEVGLEEKGEKGSIPGKEERKCKEGSEAKAASSSAWQKHQEQEVIERSLERQTRASS